MTCLEASWVKFLKKQVWAIIRGLLKNLEFVQGVSRLRFCINLWLRFWAQLIARDKWSTVHCRVLEGIWLTTGTRAWSASSPSQFRRGHACADIQAFGWGCRTKHRSKQSCWFYRSTSFCCRFPFRSQSVALYSASIKDPGPLALFCTLSDFCSPWQIGTLPNSGLKAVEPWLQPCLFRPNYVCVHS